MYIYVDHKCKRWLWRTSVVPFQTTVKWTWIPGDFVRNVVLKSVSLPGWGKSGFSLTTKRPWKREKKKWKSRMNILLLLVMNWKIVLVVCSPPSPRQTGPAPSVWTSKGAGLVRSSALTARRRLTRTNTRPWRVRRTEVNSSKYLVTVLSLSCCS